MKQVTFAIVAVLTILSFTTVATAQNRVLGRADVPFSFNAHGGTFARGSYELIQIGDHFVRLQHTATRKGVTLMSTGTVAESSTTKIVFRRYADRHVLAAIDGVSYQITLPKSDAEKETEAPNAKVVTVTMHAAP